MRCDSHVHVVASHEEFAQIPGRTFLAQEAPLETLIENGRPHGIDHFVLTQPSFYGADNTVLLEALDALDGKGSGVVTVSPDIDRSDLQQMKRRGVSGLRVNLYSPAARNVGDGTDDVTAIFQIAAEHDCHVEVIAPLNSIIARAGVLANTQVPTVIDHYGLFGNTRPGDDDGRALLQLVESDHVWMKLSSPYRHPDQPLRIEPDREWLTAFLDTCPDRCVWGSDWPHPPPHQDHGGPDVIAAWRHLSYSGLVESFYEALNSEDMIDRIMRQNPCRLYGFDPDRSSVG